MRAEGGIKRLRSLTGENDVGGGKRLGSEKLKRFHEGGGGKELLNVCRGC